VDWQAAEAEVRWEYGQLVSRMEMLTEAQPSQLAERVVATLESAEARGLTSVQTLKTDVSQVIATARDTVLRAFDLAHGILRMVGWPSMYPGSPCALARELAEAITAAAEALDKARLWDGSCRRAFRWAEGVLQRLQKDIIKKRQRWEDLDDNTLRWYLIRLTRGLGSTPHRWPEDDALLRMRDAAKAEAESLLLADLGFRVPGEGGAGLATTPPLTTDMEPATRNGAAQPLDCSLARQTVDPQVTAAQAPTFNASDSPRALEQATKGKRINERMEEMLAKDGTRIDWSAENWAQALGCSKSTVAGTQTWGVILNARSLREAERIQDMSYEHTDRRRFRKKRKRTD
jgi:hypothetical protein